MKRSLASVVAAVLTLAVCSQTLAGPSEKGEKHSKKTVTGTIASVDTKHQAITLAAVAPQQQLQTQGAPEQKVAANEPAAPQMFHVTKTTIISCVPSGKQGAADQSDVGGFDLLKVGQMVRVVYAVSEHGVPGAKAGKTPSPAATQAGPTTASDAQQNTPSTPAVPSKDKTQSAGAAQQTDVPAVPPKPKHKEHNGAHKGARAWSIEILSQAAQPAK